MALGLWGVFLLAGRLAGGFKEAYPGLVSSKANDILIELAQRVEETIPGSIVEREDGLDKLGFLISSNDAQCPQIFFNLETTADVMDLGIETLFEIYELPFDTELALEILKALADGRLKGVKRFWGKRVIGVSTHLQLDDGETFYYNSSGLIGRLIPGTEHPVVTKPYRSRKVSPRITHIAWGQMKIEGVPAGRDFKVYPGGARPWDWKESNTHHVPGIQPQDVQELLDKGCEIIILSLGMQLALHTSQEAHQLLKSLGIQYYVRETKKAVELYNQLTEEKKAVGGLFHSTC